MSILDTAIAAGSPPKTQAFNDFMLSLLTANDLRTPLYVYKLLVALSGVPNLRTFLLLACTPSSISHIPLLKDILLYHSVQCSFKHRFLDNSLFSSSHASKRNQRSIVFHLAMYFSRRSLDESRYCRRPAKTQASTSGKLMSTLSLSSPRQLLNAQLNR